MQWYNKPIKWLVDEDKLCFSVNSNTDYWQITHYGFIKDNGPFYYKEVSDDFEATVKVTGNYQELYHQAGFND